MAAANVAPSAHARTTVPSSRAITGGAHCDAASTARKGVQPAPTATPSRSIATGSSRASAASTRAARRRANGTASTRTTIDARYRAAHQFIRGRPRMTTQALAFAPCGAVARASERDRALRGRHPARPRDEGHRQQRGPRHPERKCRSHRYASEATMERIHTAARASSPSPSTRHTRPTPVVTSTSTAPGSTRAEKAR